MLIVRESFMDDLTDFFYKRDGRIEGEENGLYPIEKYLESTLSKEEYLELEEIMSNVIANKRFLSYKKGFQDGMRMLTYMYKKL
ncbi:hypothetical protein GCM10011391_01550 [Pullulanibacillus camelliae]|uniref:Uncharacterized protein n=1 Tax=Pullulanibacillus camelliae TaxID=1707096 RepID=A0A8J2VJ97_9BACL|nr:hypothetical protein [Pullulanibacillus camelliae]GGE26878.1 hypothetical protein GCM10011391_01550 [Pullulanibacillus camelliae]